MIGADFEKGVYFHNVLIINCMFFLCCSCYCALEITCHKTRDCDGEVLVSNITLQRLSSGVAGKW